MGPSVRQRRILPFLANNGHSKGCAETSALPPTADIQALRPLSCRLRLLYPQEQTFWARLGMSQIDPFETLKLINPPSEKCLD